MGEAIRYLTQQGSLVFGPVFAQPPTSSSSSSPSFIGEAVRELMGTWWLWVLILALLVLIGVLIYMRNRPED